MHIPVLLAEVIEGLQIQANGIYVDATFGRGGHSEAILDRLGPAGRLLAMDRDPVAVASGRERFGNDSRFSIVHAAFSETAAVVENAGLLGQINGLLMDLGLSSPQVDDPQRGFSFLREGPLDMRMDPTQGQSAGEFLTEASEREIADVLWRFGEERYSRRIARAVVRQRGQPLTTTSELADLIARSVPRRERHKHPATRSFQALRIYVNRELEELQGALSDSSSFLAPGGRLVVISFHSLEDRIVKHHMRGEARPPEGHQARLRIVARLIRPSDREVAQNARARSAKLRVAERLS